MGTLHELPRSFPSSDEQQRGLDARKERFELALRDSHGFIVALYWNKPTNSISIALDDHSKKRDFVVPNDKALDAFYHPGAYLPDYLWRDMQGGQ